MKIEHNNTSNDASLIYKALAMAFAYPDEAFFRCFQIGPNEREGIQAEYDRLFRTGTVWLEGAEHRIDNEFQRVAELSDIMGFYRAFGVVPRQTRPDALTCELEFMHVLEAKRARAERGDVSGDAEEKAAVCREAQAKFYREHLAPAAIRIASLIREATTHPFYREAAAELKELMATEALRFGRPVEAPVLDSRDDSRIEWEGCSACQEEDILP